MNNYFYGWYFRCQGEDGSMAVIPAVHLSETEESCSIQVITKNGSYYRTFPIQELNQQGKREHEDWRKPVFQKRNSNEAGNGSNFGRSGDEERYRREEISKDYRSSTLW